MSRYRCADVWPFQGIGLCLVHFHKGKGTHIIRVSPLERSICGQNGKKLGKIAEIRRKQRENQCPVTGAPTYGLCRGSEFILVHSQKGKSTHIIRLSTLERSICGQNGKKTLKNCENQKEIEGKSMSRYRCADVWPWYGVGLCLVHSHEEIGRAHV